MIFSSYDYAYTPRYPGDTIDITPKVSLLLAPLDSKFQQRLMEDLLWHFDITKSDEKGEGALSTHFLWLDFEESGSPYDGDNSDCRSYRAQRRKWKFRYYACSSNHDIVFAVCVGKGHDCID
jgi:hypothetical protein